MSDIAVIGMACRVPGADSIDEFWRNLRDGVESITFFSDDQLLAAGVDRERLRDPRYVRARGILRDVESFDAGFFGLSPREAEVMDPQHRLLLEGAWEALEHAGYDPGAYDGSIGVFAGAGMNGYLLNNLYPNRDRLTLGGFQVMLGNERDFLATRLSYRLNLRGPSINVQAACSTSLVAVHLACQSLLDGECDMALAGGVSIHVPQFEGYAHEEGMIFSPDGHCRAFDAKAAGTVSGNGMGVVVLKPLDEAIAAGDCIHAVIKGSAINNDGTAKVGYTAPSIDGQAAVIAEAHAVAGIDAESVTCIEAHGTGTELGDPIEIAALTGAFRSKATGFCAIGSVKSNVGHLDAAAGVVGLIKTVLALEHRTIPATLHFEKPNPKIDFSKTPFHVAGSPRDWVTNGVPRRAGLSAFGIGGTNAHVVLEEAPPVERSRASTGPHGLVLSARSQAALDQMAKNLAAYLETHRDLNLADVAFTLRHGRRAFPVRREVVCHDLDEAVRMLRSPATSSTAPAAEDSGHRVPLPTYPFERQRCWIDSPRSHERASVAELSSLRVADPAAWFYAPVWKQSAALAGLNPGFGTAQPCPTATDQRWLILADDFGIGAKLAERVGAIGGQAILTGHADSGQLIAANTIVHLRALHAPGDVAHALKLGFDSLLELARALGDVSHPVRLAIISNNIHDITGGDLLASEQAVVLGPATVIPLEYPNVDARSIDITLPKSSEETEALAEILLREVSASSAERLVAYRGQRRWVRGFEPIRLDSSESPVPRRGGVYLITGGSGGIGLALANFLIRTVEAKVALVARSEIQNAPAGAAVYRADVTDAARMREVISDIRARFGTIHGVIHAAGVPPDGLIHHKTAQSAAAVLAPKVRGTLVLKELLADSKLDFFLLCSSLRSLVPAAGMADYVAANAFLDAFANQHHASLNAISVNWEGWREVGMGMRALEEMNERERQEAGMSTAEGTEAFRRIVENPRPQIAMSMHDLPALARFMPSVVKMPPAAATHARPELATEYVAPRNDLERLLAKIWQELLGVDPIGIHDSFLEIGGDSVLSLQLIARAKEEGIELTPRQVFEKQTIAELAALAGSSDTVPAEQETVSGPVPLTPIQRWFFEQNPPEPRHYNQSLMLAAPFDLDAAPIEAAVYEIVRHHDALRLRFGTDPFIDSRENAALFEVITVSSMDELHARVAALQASLDLERGPLIRVALFRISPREGSRLLIVIHHLCVDAFSWRFLLQDLLIPGPLPRKTTSFKKWAEALTDWARSPELAQELPFWDRAIPAHAPALPADFENGSNTFGDSSRIDFALSAAETTAFERTLHARGCRPDEILLAAFAAAFSKWTHQPGLLVDVELLGRNAPIPGVDVSRTAGWFTSLVPLFVTQPSIDAVRRQLRSVPQSGIGYGVLRYLTESGTALAAKPQAEVSFTYLGSMEAGRLPEPYTLAADAGPSISPRMPRRYRIEIEASMKDGRVHIGIVFSQRVHRRSTIARLEDFFRDALRSLLDDSRAPFAVSGVDPARMERLVGEIEEANREE